MAIGTAVRYLRKGEWQKAHVIFGCGSTKPHTSTHPAFALR